MVLILRAAFLKPMPSLLHKKSLTRYRGATTTLLVVLPLVCAIGSLALGTYGTSPLQVCHIIFASITGQTSGIDPMAINLIKEVRLPRVLTAALVGAGLSVTGAYFQALFKNPLAAPDTLGVSNGAGFGAALAIVVGATSAGTQIGAIIFGLVAVFLAFSVVARGQTSTVTLILSGMLVGSLFSSLIALLKFIADPTEKLPQIIYWLMGSLSGASYRALFAVLPLYLVGMVVLFLFRWKANVISLGDVEARSFGVDIKRDKAIIIASCSVITALAVSISGVIGWVGIVVPHLARMLVGPDFRRLLPASVSLGMCYLIVIDDICRSISVFEIPLGVVTGIIGVPLFLYFIYRHKVSWS